jgi:YggT family protein
MGYLSNAGVFLIQTLFGIYEVIILLRFLLQLVRADFYNPISRFIVKATSLPLRPLRRIIPGVAGMDLASLVLLLAVIVVELLLLSMVANLPMPALPGLLALALVELFKLLIYVFLFSVFVLAILSWWPTSSIRSPPPSCVRHGGCYHPWAGWICLPWSS